MGGNWESKEIDYPASLTKQEAVRLLDGVSGFAVVPQIRQDYLAFCCPTVKIARELFWLRSFARVFQVCSL